MDTGLGKMEPINNELGDQFNQLNKDLSGEKKIPVFQIGEMLRIKGGTYE